MLRRSGLIFGTVLLALLARAAAEEEFAFRVKYLRTVNLDNTTIIATKVDHAPKFDGTLNDPLWKTAGQTQSAFVNFPSKELCGRQTVTFCCYDNENLYFGFDCEEPELDQQQIDNGNIPAADHVGVHLEVGDTRGRGVRCNIIGNRSGCNYGGPWREQKIQYECKAGPNRWFVLMGIPFKSLQGTDGPPLRGEVWGVKFTRYGKNSETGASRMRSCWPFIPTISEDVVSYNASLCFGANNMLDNGALSGNGKEIAGWTANGSVDATAKSLNAEAGATLQQNLSLRAGMHYCVEWTAAPEFKGDVTALCGGKTLMAKDLAKGQRIDFQLPKETKDLELAVKLQGHGAPPQLRLTPVIDDVPADWICLTNNDWVPERNLKNKIPAAPDGVYTYLKTPMRDFGRAYYTARGCPDPAAKELPYEWMVLGRPTRKPLAAPPPRPDIGEEEFENFPYEVIYQDNGVPEFCGLPSGSFDAGGMQGWIPFSKGSLTGDPSWAGWPVDRWAQVAPHDVVFDFKDKYFIRRIDIQQINSGVRNLEIFVRDNNPKESFATVYRFNGPGTERSNHTIIPVYFSQSGLDSVAQQLRLSMAVDGPYGAGAAVSSPNLGRVNCQVGLYGLAEVWIWAEPKGNHADNEIKEFKAFIPNAQPPLKFDQLHKINEPVLWPRPKELVKGEGRFEIKPTTTLLCAKNGRLPDVAQLLLDDVKDRFLTSLQTKTPAEASGGENAIAIGVVGTDPAFDALCVKAGIATAIDSGEPQSFTLKVTPTQTLIAAADAEGAAHGVRTLLQWIEHDETTPFLRAVTIHDWPLLKYRTIVPSSDHRQPLLPVVKNPWNYFSIVNAVSYFRFNSMIDWLPTELYQNSEEKTRELLHYSSRRFTDIRPALWLRSVPGDCIEANPDDQPDGQGGIANSDGTWESDNLCPSNPKSYLALEQFLDTALRTHDTGRFVEVGYMGSLGKAWNVCRLCRKRGLSGYDLYADFLNKINSICRERNRTGIFTNAIMFSEAVQRASAARNPAEAFDSVNRGIAVRFDRPTNTGDIMKSGFWTISKPWDTPQAAANGAGYAWGGKAYFDKVSDGTGSEGVLCAGERCDYDWYWRGELGGRVMLTADAFWNGPAPEGAKRPEFDQQAANACVRFNERVGSHIEYPSWRTGMTPKFFQLDIKALCNRSHIDEGSASGMGRSGPKEGVNGFGAAFDFRRVPMGAQTFADVPFEVIDPAQNKWKSMIVVGTGVKEALIPGAVSSVSIPVGRKAASMCVLRANLRTVARSGQMEHYFNILQPAYVFEYSDGSRCVCDWEIRRNFNDIVPQTFYYGGGVGGSVLSFLLPTTRIAYATNTISGAGANLFLSEIVNPYPEKDVRNLVVQLPNPEHRDYTFEFHDAIFAVTGVEPVEWDVKFWKEHSKPLLPPNPALPADAKKIEGLKFNDNGKLPVRVFESPAPKPLQLQAMKFRLAMPPGYNGNAMCVRSRHADVIVSVTADGKTWTEAAKLPACTGMDGEHTLVFPPVQAAAIRLTLDCTPYTEEDNADISFVACELFEK